jgi:hypothetical protein
VDTVEESFSNLKPFIFGLHRDQSHHHYWMANFFCQTDRGCGF